MPTELSANMLLQKGTIYSTVILQPIEAHKYKCSKYRIPLQSSMGNHDLKFITQKMCYHTEVCHYS